MFYYDAVYDIDELLKRNMHLHTNFSGCAKPEMVLEDIVRTAEKCGLEAIALTDHSNVGDMDRIVAKNTPILRQQLAGIDTKLKVYIGSELSAYGIGKFSETEEFCKTLDYRLYSQNHYHMPFWEQPEDKSARGYAENILAVLKSLFESGREADCIAHPFIGGYIRCIDDKESVPNMITDAELGDILEIGEKAGCAWEINCGAFIGIPDFSRRYWNIGREVGVHFNFGTDGHRLNEVDTKIYANILKKIVM